MIQAILGVLVAAFRLAASIIRRIPIRRPDPPPTEEHRAKQKEIKDEIKDEITDDSGAVDADKFADRVRRDGF